MTIRPLDQLSPESRAVLSLILLQSRSYADIASLLHLGESDVRARAHAAARALAGDDVQPDDPTRERVIDYLLGEQTVSERATTRAALAEDPVARGWARRLSDGLAPLAKTPLPAIPGEPADPTPAPDSTATPKTPATQEPPEPVTDPEWSARPNVVIRPRPSMQPLPPARRFRLPPTRAVVPALVVLVVVVVAVILISSGGGKSPHATTTSGSGVTGQGQTVARFVLRGTGVARTASGSGSVARQHGGLLLLLSARGLAPNKDNSYGVWLFNSARDARLLGFVNPPVGKAGTFSSGATLPDDASRFHALLVTVETSTHPTTPGPVLLHAPLSLS